MNDDELGRKVADAIDSIPVPPDLNSRLGALRPPRTGWRAAAPWALAAAAALFAVAVTFAAPRGKPPIATPAQDDDERLRALHSLEKRVLRALEDPNLKDEFVIIETTARFGNDAVPFLRELLNRFLSASTSKDLNVNHAGSILRTIRDIDTDESAAVLLDAMENPDLIFPEKYRLLSDAFVRMKSKKIGPRVMKHYAWLAKYFGDHGDAGRLLDAVARHGGAEGAKIVLRLYRDGNAALKTLGFCDDSECAELYAKDFFDPHSKAASTLTFSLGMPEFPTLSLATKKALLKGVCEGASGKVESAVWLDTSPDFVEHLTATLKTAPLKPLIGGFVSAYFEQTPPKHILPFVPAFLAASVDVALVIKKRPESFRTPEIRAALQKLAKETDDVSRREAYEAALAAIGP